jgi:hypothetical protein
MDAPKEPELVHIYRDDGDNYTLDTICGQHDNGRMSIDTIHWYRAADYVRQFLYCPACLAGICKHCKERKTDHADGTKCLFLETTFEAATNGAG